MKRLLLITILSACGLAAQAPGMFPWWDSPIARDLKLSDDQNKKIHEIVSESRTRIIQLRANLEAADGDLRDRMDDDPVDTRKAGAAIEKVLAARTELERAVSNMTLRMRQVLSGQQWHELERRHAMGGSRPPNPPPECRPRGGAAA